VVFLHHRRDARFVCACGRFQAELGGRPGGRLRTWGSAPQERYSRSYAFPTDRLFGSLGPGRCAGRRSRQDAALHAYDDDCSCGFRGSLEGWARAGIKYCEFTSSAVDAFLKTEDVAAARRLIADLGLTPVSCGSVVGLWEPNPKRAAVVDSLKQRCEMYSSLGLKQIVCPCNTTQKVSEDDYKMGLDNMREVGEIVKQYPMTAMVEFSRGSTFIGTLSTSLQMTRDAAHPNVRPMLDCYHFWAGQSKLRIGFDPIRRDPACALSGCPSGPAPRVAGANHPRDSRGWYYAAGAHPSQIVRKGYAGPLSVELFRPEFQNADPYELASRIRAKAEPIMREAGVL